MRTRLLILLVWVPLAAQSRDSFLAAARKAEVAGNFAAAEREYERAVGLQADAATLQRLGLVRHLQNKYETAIRAFEQSLKLDPNQWSAHLFLGIDEYRTNRFGAALPELKRALELRPEDPEARFWLGVTELALKDYFPGLAILEKLSREQPKNVEILRILAENYAVFGMSLLNGVAEKYPDTPAGLQVHAQALEFEGANEQALRVYREIDRQAPGRPGIAEAIARLTAVARGQHRPSPPADDDGSPIPP